VHKRKAFEFVGFDTYTFNFFCYICLSWFTKFRGLMISIKITKIGIQQKKSQ